MAHFYGQLRGNRGHVTRTSTKSEGISASVQSYAGSVTTWLEDSDGDTVVTIAVGTGSVQGGRELLRVSIAELLTVKRLRPDGYYKEA